MAVALEKMSINIRMLDGTLHILDFEVSAQRFIGAHSIDIRISCTVYQAKQKIFEKLQIPVEFQKLLHSSGAVLECNDLILGEAVELRLMVSLEDCCAILEGSDEAEQCKALKVIEKSHHLCKNNISC